MIPQLPGRLNRLLFSWAMRGDVDAFCRRFSLLNGVRWGYPIRVATVWPTPSCDPLLRITDDTGRVMHIGRPIRLPLYTKGLLHRRQQILKEYLLNEIEFSDRDLIVDVGANVGDLTTALQEKANVHAICIEPEARENAALGLNVTPDRTTVYQSLLFSEQRDVMFYSANEGGDSSIFEPTHHSGGSLRRTMTLDALLANDRLFQSHRKLKLLKLEAEGAEPEILMGASDALNCCQYVAADVGPERGARQENTVIPVLQALLDRGFKPVRFGLPRCVMLFRNTAS